MTIGLGPIVVVAARRLQVLDVPSHRSSHQVPTPRSGGIAPAVGSAVALLSSSFVAGSARTGLLVCACAFGVLGLAEDIKGVPPLSRLAAQLGIAGGAATWLLSDLDGSMVWQAVFATGAVVWVVAYVNAFNFMDGIDGISVAQTVVAGLAWYAIGRAEDVDLLAAAGIIVAGAGLGFAPLNCLRARIFLGDVGSYFLGAWLACAALVGLRAGVPPEAVLAPLSLYLADTGVTLVRRVARGDTWYLPHRDHAYQQLVILGWSHTRTSALAGATMAVLSGLGAVALGSSRTARVAADAALVATVVAYLSSPALVRRLADSRRLLPFAGRAG